MPVPRVSTSHLIRWRACARSNYNTSSREIYYLWKKIFCSTILPNRIENDIDFNVGGDVQENSKILIEFYGLARFNKNSLDERFVVFDRGALNLENFECSIFGIGSKVMNFVDYSLTPVCKHLQLYRDILETEHFG